VFRQQKRQDRERQRRFRYPRLNAAVSIGGIMACGLSRFVIMMVSRVMSVFVDKAGVFEERV
jgi:hypothetical protein